MLYRRASSLPEQNSYALCWKWASPTTQTLQLVYVTLVRQKRLLRHKESGCGEYIRTDVVQITSALLSALAKRQSAVLIPYSSPCSPTNSGHLMKVGNVPTVWGGASCTRWNSVTGVPQNYFTGEKCVKLLLTWIANVTLWGKDFLDNGVEQTNLHFIEAANSKAS